MSEPGVRRALGGVVGWVLGNGLVIGGALLIGSMLLSVFSLDNFFDKRRERVLVIERNNAIARRDTLKTLYQDALVEVRERQVFINDSLLEIEHEQSRKVREGLGRELLVAARTVTALRSQLRGRGDAPTLTPDSADTVLRFRQSDSLMVVTATATVRQTRLPSDVRVDWLVDVSIPEVPLFIAVSVDPETCEVFLDVTTTHPGVRTVAAQASVDEVVNVCLPRGGGWFWRAAAVAGWTAAALATVLGN